MPPWAAMAAVAAGNKSFSYSLICVTVSAPRRIMAWALPKSSPAMLTAPTTFPILAVPTSMVRSKDRSMHRHTSPRPVRRPWSSSGRRMGSSSFKMCRRPWEKSSVSRGMSFCPASGTWGAAISPYTGCTSKNASSSARISFLMEPPPSLSRRTAAP